MAGVFPLISELCVHDDQRRVFGGVAAFEAHTSRPCPKRCMQKGEDIKGKRYRVNKEGGELKERVRKDVTQNIKSSKFRTDLKGFFCHFQFRTHACILA